MSIYFNLCKTCVSSKKCQVFALVSLDQPFLFISLIEETRSHHIKKNTPLSHVSHQTSFLSSAVALSHPLLPPHCRRSSPSPLLVQLMWLLMLLLPSLSFSLVSAPLSSSVSHRQQWSVSINPTPFVLHHQLVIDLKFTLNWLNLKKKTQFVNPNSFFLDFLSHLQ